MICDDFSELFYFKPKDFLVMITNYQHNVHCCIDIKKHSVVLLISLCSTSINFVLGPPFESALEVRYDLFMKRIMQFFEIVDS